MSALAGILRLHGAAASAADGEAMATTMPHRRGGEVHAHGPVALTPLSARRGAVALAFTGRLDNGVELRRLLGTSEQSDSGLVVEAYERWGTAAVVRLLGDFALALWDEREGRLLCARDFLGKRPLYYHRGAVAFVWGSEPQAVLEGASLPVRPNLGMLGEHLAADIRSSSETLVEGLQRLPPAHLLTVTRDGALRVQRYWEWDPDRTVSHRSDAGFIEEFRALFTEAVRARLTDDAPVAAELSGGVDSSSVVAVAAGLADIDVYSLVFPGLDCDESEHIHAVAAHVGVTPHEAEPRPAGADFYLEQIRLHRDLPEPPNMAMHRVIYEAARARGTRVVLTGLGGDEWFSGSPLAYADRLRALRPGGLGDLRRAAASQRDLWPARSLGHQFFRDGVLPLLPAGLQDAVRRATGRAGALQWMAADFCRDIGLAERLRRPDLRGPRLAAAHIAGSLDDGSLAHNAEVGERALATVGLEGRSPFEDRRLVEFALALPEGLRQRNGVPKWVVRTAMEGLLPDAIRTRGDDPGFREVFFREFETQGGSKLFTNLAIEAHGWVDGARLRRSYEEFTTLHRRGQGHPHVWALWNALSVERWVRKHM